MATGFKLITPNAKTKPAYLAPTAEAGFGSTLTRITGDTGALIPGLLPDTWNSDARHGYSRRNPWNCDGTLAYLEQRGGTPSKFIVDAKTWAPLKGNVGNFRACTEVRWHPTQPTTMIGWNKSTLEVVVFDVLSNSTAKRIKVGIASVGLMGEGSLSDDGSMVALGDIANHVVLVDIAGGRMGPLQKVEFVRAPTHSMGNCTVGPLATSAGGNFVAKASDTPELVRVYKFGADLVLKPSFESELTLSHADVGLTADGREVFCGGARTWYGAAGGFSKDNGNVAAIFLDNGEIRNISAGKSVLGTKEAADQHCSCRGVPGWVLETVAGAHETSGRFLMELVAWPLDGSRACIRFGVTRTNESGMYRAEAHGVMRPGKVPTAAMFASNWGSGSDVKSYVYELVGVPAPIPPIDPPPPTPSARFVVDPAWSYSPPAGVVDTVTGRLVPLAELANAMNATLTK